MLMQRWIKELENESCSGSVEDGTESTSSQQSTSSRSTPNPLSTGTASSHIMQAFVNTHKYTYIYETHPLMFSKIAELNVPLKKRRAKYVTEMTPAPSDHLLRPLSPITPPIPEDPLHLPHPNPCGALLPNGLTYSPIPSLSASRCNTPLQFEVRTQHHSNVTNRVCVHGTCASILGCIASLMYVCKHYWRRKIFKSTTKIISIENKNEWSKNGTLWNPAK